MFSIRRDFGFFGKIFGVPRAWLSRVGAFCSSWSVEGNLLTLSIPENPDPLRNPIRLGLNSDAIAALTGSASGTGTAVDETASTDTTIAPGSAYENASAVTLDASDKWTAGNAADANYVGLMVSRIVAPSASSAWRYIVFRSATYTPKGQLLSVGPEIFYIRASTT